VSVTVPVVAWIDPLAWSTISGEVQPQGRVFAEVPVPDFATTITLDKPVGLVPNIEIVCNVFAQQLLPIPPLFEGTCVM